MSKIKQGAQKRKTFGRGDKKVQTDYNDDDNFKVEYDAFHQGLRVKVLKSEDSDAVSVHLIRAATATAKSESIFKAYGSTQWNEILAQLDDIYETRPPNLVKPTRITFGDKQKFKIDVIPTTDGASYVTIISICRYLKGAAPSTQVPLIQPQYYKSEKRTKEDWFHDQSSILLEDTHIEFLLNDDNITKL